MPASEKESKVYVARVLFEGMKSMQWHLFDGTRRMFARGRESKNDIQKRWIKCYGAPSKWIRYSGTMGQRELKLVIAYVQREAKDVPQEAETE